jgi:Helicase conserved C-terminal domain
LSELLLIASALRRATDSELQQLIAQRMVNSAGLRDFFDLAEALSAQKSVASAVSGLPKNQIDALIAIIEGNKPDASAAAQLAQLMLVDRDKDGNFTAFESTAACLRTLEPQGVSLEVSDEASPSVESVDRDAGIATFETIQALTELIFDAEQRYIREVGKKNVGLPDIKRLAQHVRQSNDFAREIYELANHADLIGLANSRWQLGAKASEWLSWQPQQRHAHLIEVWHGLIGPTSADEISQAFVAAKNQLPLSLSRHLQTNYPFADSATNSRISKVVVFAERIGVSHNGWLSSWAADALAGKYSKASSAAAAFLPEPQNRLICQADLSLITPGPLPTEIEILLRRFADTEQIGMASTYRLSALSISHGLETGLTETEIRDLLVKLSEKPLPQPVDYLIREAGVRFGRLTISAGELETKSVVKSLDTILLAQILNDSRLKPFAMYALPDSSIGCRFEPEMLYFGLREAGYSAVRVGTDGKVISPRSPIANSEKQEQVSTVASDIQRLREQDQKLGSEPDGDDLVRSIQLAIKNKSIIIIGVITNSGAEVEFTLEPIGFANGRLRAKDKKADIERTLPLSSITRVALG